MMNRSVLWVTVIVLGLAAVAAPATVHDPAKGQVAIGIDEWDRMGLEAKRLWVLNAATDCHRAGYDGRVTAWSDDGRRVLATYEFGQRVRILRGWQADDSSADGAALPLTGRDLGDPEIGWLLLVLAVAAVCVIFVILVAIVRWVFRVNVIVAHQEETCKLLAQIVGRLHEQPPKGAK